MGKKKASPRSQAANGASTGELRVVNDVFMTPVGSSVPSDDFRRQNAEEISPRLATSDARTELQRPKRSTVQVDITEGMTDDDKMMIQDINAVLAEPLPRIPDPIPPALAAGLAVDTITDDGDRFSDSSSSIGFLTPRENVDQASSGDVSHRSWSQNGKDSDKNTPPGSSTCNSSSTACQTVQNASKPADETSFRSENTSNTTGQIPNVSGSSKMPEQTKTTLATPRFRNRVGLIYDPLMLEHRNIWAGEEAIERPARLSGAWNELSVQGLTRQECVSAQGLTRQEGVMRQEGVALPGLTRQECVGTILLDPRDATEAELTVAGLGHTSGYVGKIKETEEMGDDVARLKDRSAQFEDVFFCQETYKCAVRAAGCTLEATEAVLTGRADSALALVRPPGHHASAETPCGFCIVNNVALAALNTRKSQGPDYRILIIDMDIHHGNGTQAMVASDPNILYFSVHRYERGRFWPNLRESNYDYIGQEQDDSRELPDRTRLGRTVNFPLNCTAVSDAEYYAIFHHILLPLAGEFGPDLILVSAGFDCLFGDPEGEMNLTPGGYGGLIRSLMPVCGPGVKLVCVLEGGYFLPSLNQGVDEVMKSLLGFGPPNLPEFNDRTVKRPITDVIYALAGVLSPHWQCMTDLKTFLDLSSSNAAEMTALNSDDTDSAKNDDRTAAQNAQEKDAITGQTHQTDPPPTDPSAAITYKPRFPEPDPKALTYIGTPEWTPDQGPYPQHGVYPPRHPSVEEAFRLELQAIVDRAGPRRMVGRTGVWGDGVQIDGTNAVSYGADPADAGISQLMTDLLDHGTLDSGVILLTPPSPRSSSFPDRRLSLLSDLKKIIQSSRGVSCEKKTLTIDIKNAETGGIEAPRSRGSGGISTELTFDPNEGRGEPLELAVPMPEGGGLVDWVWVLHQLVFPVSQCFNPNLVIVICSPDAVLCEHVTACLPYMLYRLSGSKIVVVLGGQKQTVDLTIKSESQGQEGSLTHSEALSKTELQQKKLMHAVLCCLTGTSVPALPGTVYTSDILDHENAGPKVKRRSDNSQEPVSHDLLLATARLCNSPQVRHRFPAYFGPPEEVESVGSGSGGKEGAVSVFEILMDLEQAQGSEGGVDGGCGFGGQGQVAFAVTPLPDCPHLRPDVILTPVPPDVKFDGPCKACGNVGENWVCLTCGEINCGRFVAKHGLAHYQAQNHPVALSYADLSCWCYVCDAYLDNPLILSWKNKAHLLKFGSEIGM